MATKPFKTGRAAPPKKPKAPQSDEPKRHALIRRDGEIHGPEYKIGSNSKAAALVV